MEHRTSDDDKRDIKEEKELYKSMKNNSLSGTCIKLKKRIKELESINARHKHINGKLRTHKEKKKRYTMAVHETLCYRFETKAYNIKEAEKKLKQQIEKVDWSDVSPDDSSWEEGNVEELNNE